MKTILLFAALIPAVAQVDLSGNWQPQYHEDQPERIPGPELGDYLGLPITNGARLFAESWDPGRLTLQEHQCRVHISPYIYRGPLQVRIWEEKDPKTQTIIAIKNYISTYEQTRTIWMDGREHPPAYAPHTWMGFSTGKWEGDILTVYTTHIKQGWVRRNGLPESDQATLVEHFIRHGDHLTHVSIVTDPVYLTEPLIKTQDFVLNPRLNGNWLWPCEYVVEVATREKGAVPHYLPGTNQFNKEFRDKHKIPEIAQRGGAETMYPEFRQPLVGQAGSLRPIVNRPSPVPPDNGVHIYPVQANLYLLTTPGGNMAVQAGKDGVLLIDTGNGKLTNEILAAIRTVSDKPIRYILNTHFHADHTGGNEALAKAGVTIEGGPGFGAIGVNTGTPQGAHIYAHENVMNRMSAPSGKQSPVPTSFWPTDTYFVGDREVFFNGESVQMIHRPAAHTDGDSIIYFRRSDVVVTGDIFVTTTFPVIDVANGGTIQGEIDGLNKILDLTIPEHEQEGGTYVIPGHGRICDEADVVEYRDMVTIIRDRIRELKKKGQTLEQVKASRPTLDFDARYGDPAAFIEAVYRTLK